MESADIREACEGGSGALCASRRSHDGPQHGAADPSCGTGGGGGRPPNAHERKILDLWNMEGLSSAGFTVSAVVDFAERVRHLIRCH